MSGPRPQEKGAAMATSLQPPARQQTGEARPALTIEQVAAVVATEFLGAHSHSLDAYVWGLAEGTVVTVNITQIDDYGNTEAQNTRAFRALVFDGDGSVPIVLARPDVVDTLTLEGGSFGEPRRIGWEVAPADEAGRATRRADATGVIFQGSGHVDFAEARRMGAALIALADAAEDGPDGERHG